MIDENMRDSRLPQAPLQLLAIGGLADEFPQRHLFRLNRVKRRV